MSDAKPVAEEAAINPAETTTSEAALKVAETENQTTEAAEATDAVAVAATEKAEENKENLTNAEESVESSKATNGDSDKKDDTARNGDSEKKNDNARNYDRGSDRRQNRDSGFRYKKANRNEFDDLPESDDPVEIREQMEFYFTNHNLASDEHMFLEMEGPKNLPISVKHMTTFKRMRRFNPYSAVVAAIRESETLEIVDDGKFTGAGNEGVKRKTPITVPARDSDEKSPPTTQQLFSRFKGDNTDRLGASIYVKNFGADEVNQIDIEKFFKPYSSLSVRKRRDDDGKWKGSVFVEFDSVQAQKDFLALDPIPKFNGNELYVQGKREYNEMKCKEKGIDPSEWNKGTSESHYGRSGGRGRGNGRGRGFSRGGDRGGHRGRGGRFNDRSDRHDNRRNNRSRSRSPRRRRDRSGSPDNRDWNGRRDKFQKGGYRDNRRDRKHEDKRPDHSLKLDARGVPIVRDTRGEPDYDPRANKRKATEDADRKSSPKKSKIEFKEDA